MGQDQARAPRGGDRRGGSKHGGDRQERRASSGRAAGRPHGPAGSDRSGRGTRRKDGPPGSRDTAAPANRTSAPPLPDDADPAMLAPEVRNELRSLARPNAERVARHLVAAGGLVDVDPQAALAHARAARATAGRIGVVREAAGIAAYHAGEWAEALSELRAARRITGDSTHLPVIADCERALGRPERALELAGSAEAAALPQEPRVEMRIVAAGARQDLGEFDAAVVTLQGPDLDRDLVQPWSPRLWYAYADALLAAGRRAEAYDWFVAVAMIDEDGLTDAHERIEDFPHPGDTDDVEVRSDPADG